MPKIFTKREYQEYFTKYGDGAPVCYQLKRGVIMRYEDDKLNTGEIAENIYDCYQLIVELKKLDDAQKRALIDAVTLKKITSYDALHQTHERSKHNLIELIELFPKDRRVALISSTFRSDSTLVSYDLDHDVFSRFYQTSAEVYLRDFTDNMSDFVQTWESFVKNLAMYVKSKNDQQIERALYDVLKFIPEDSIEQFFKEIGVEKLLSLNGIDSLLQKYDFCETLILSEVNNEIGKLEDVPAVLRKIPPNSFKKFYDKLCEKIPGLADDINAFAYVLARSLDCQSSALINAAPASMGVDTLINDHDKLIQVVFNLNPKLRLAFLKNLGVIDSFKAGITSEKQALKNVLRQLLPWLERFKLDDLIKCVAPQAATSDAHKRVQGSASSEFEAFLASRGLDVKKPDDWKKNVEMCRVWIPGLLRDCFLRPAWESDRVFCQQIHNSSVDKLTVLAETGRYPEAELAMLMVSLAENKPVEAARWLEKFKAWNTWFAWEEYKNNRRVMKGLTVACQECHERLDFEFNCLVSITNDKQSDIFRSFVDTMKIVLSNRGDADRRRIVDYFKSPAFNCLTDEDRARYKSAVIVQKKAVEIPFAVPVPVEKDAPRRGLVGRSANFFIAHPGREADLLAIVAGLQVPSNVLPVVGAVVEEEEELTPKQKLLV